MKNQARNLKIIEWAFWPIFLLTNNIVLATSILMEFSRRGQEIDTWVPFVTEFTSGLFILLLIPVIVWVDGRTPFQKTSWKKVAGMHFLLTIPFSLIHVGGMVALRKIVFFMKGRFYDFGDIPVELFYEYRKDLLTYVAILAILYGYRHFRYRYFEATLESKTDSQKSLTRILIKTGSKKKFLKIDEIELLEAAGNYVTIHVNGSRYFLRATLAKLEEKLPGEKFVRVHRSYIVNLDQIKEIIPTPSGDARIVMKSGAHTGMSRRYRDRLKPLEI